MCKKLIIVVLALSFCLISSARATISWDFENGNGCRFDLWSVQGAGFAIDDPTIAGDESLTGVGGPGGLPSAGLAWSVGSPNQYDGLKPAVADGARIGADGLLNYSLGTEDIPTGSGTLNTYNLNQDGDNLHTAANDQIATSTPITLGENAVLTVWAYGGGSGTHAPTYDPDPTLMYTNGSCGIAVLLAEDYSILASVKIGGQGTLKEDTLDLSAFAGQTVLIEVVDAFDGSWGWLAVDEIQISNTDQNPVAGFIVQLTEGELAWGFDQAQYDHLVSLGYDVDVISHLDLADGTFTKADANGYDVLIISESPNSNGCDSIIGTSAPMMHQEAFGWDNNFFMGVRTNIRWLDGQTQVEVVNDTHPIMVDAGFSVGKLPWFTAPEKYTTEDINMMAPGAELLVKADAEEAAVVFAIEKGGELANGNLAAGRVVGFSISGAQDGANQINGILDTSIMADEQWALYDAALRWLDPAPVPELEVAGELLVDVSAADPSAGTATWVNNGTLDDFTFITQADLDAHPDTHAMTPGMPPAVEEFEGVPVVNITSSDANLVAYTGPISVPGIEGDSDRTIEAWVADVNEIPSSQVIIAWGYRATAQSCCFSYGTRNTFGALIHYGDDYDVPWGNNFNAPKVDGVSVPGDEVPTLGTLHHLVYTYEGTAVNLYVDGQLVVTRTLGGPLKTSPGLPINLFLQNRRVDGGFDRNSLPASLLVNSIRVHDGVLTDAQVLNNYEVGPAK